MTEYPALIAPDGGYSRPPRTIRWIKRIAFPLGLRLGIFSQYSPKLIDINNLYKSNRVAINDPQVISIVTPSYNQATYLEGTLRSVLDQGYPNLEYFVQDGGSTDGSLDILHRYASKLQGWVSAKDKGQADAINRGFAKTTGSIMGWLNSDDRLTSGSLHAVAQCFQRFPEIDVVYGHRIIVNPSGLEVGRWITPRHHPGDMIWADYIPQETMFWRRRLWEQVGGRIDPTLNFAIDWDLVARFERAGARFYRLPRFQGIFTTHDAQKSRAIKESVGRQEFERVRSRYAGKSIQRLGFRLRNYAHLARSVAYFWGYRAGVLRY